MASTYGNDLRLEEIGDGEQSGTWGATTNTNLELIAEALSFGTEAITTNADTHTTTIADGATDPGRSLYLKYTGTLDSTCTITIAPNSISKTWYIENGTSGSQSIIISQGSGANVTIPTGQTKIVYSDGAGSGAAMAEIGTLGVTNLAVTTNATVGGTLGVTGVLTGTSLDISGNVDIDGTLETDALSINSTAVTSTAAELNILDGVTATASELNIMDGVTATTAELNIMDGVTSTTAELNILDGVTSTTAELNILDGVTSTATEINQLDAITRGSILYGNASGVTARLAKGAAGTVLTSDGTDLAFAAVASGAADVVFPNIASPNNTYTSSGTWSKGSLSDDAYVWFYMVGGGGGGGSQPYNPGSIFVQGGLGAAGILIYAQASLFDGAAYVVGAGSAGRDNPEPGGSNPTPSTLTLSSSNGSGVYSTGTSNSTANIFTQIDGKTIIQSTTLVSAVNNPSNVFVVPTARPTGWSGAFTGDHSSYQWQGGVAGYQNAAGGNGIFGGGGGGGHHASEGTDNPNGGSLYAGAGGNVGNTGAAGSAPGGGGGGSKSYGVDGGDGGNGNIRVYHV